jgi:hypothetical protein
MAEVFQCGRLTHRVRPVLRRWIGTHSTVMGVPSRKTKQNVTSRPKGPNHPHQTHLNGVEMAQEDAHPNGPP